MAVEYQEPGIDLHQGDCLAVMATLPDASFDAIITDPPYGTTACSWDAVIPFGPMWKQLKRLIRPRGAIVLFGSQPFTSALVMSNPEMYRYSWVWDKLSVSNPQLAKHHPLKDHEDICVFSIEPHHYHPQGIFKTEIVRTKDTSNLAHCKRRDYVQTWTNYPRSLLRYSVERGFHPTQKPIDLISYLIRTYTNEDDNVLDFTCGSGTTLVAAKITGRRATGIEQDRGYCDVTAQRLRDATMPLFVDVPIVTAHQEAFV